MTRGRLALRSRPLPYISRGIRSYGSQSRVCAETGDGGVSFGDEGTRTDRIRTGLFRLGDEEATRRLVGVYWSMWQHLEKSLPDNSGYYVSVMRDMIERRAASPRAPRLEGESMSIEELAEQAEDELQMMKAVYPAPN